jgi:uncharacterized membrane protein HdeD (DUF308 family)
MAQARLIIDGKDQGGHWWWFALLGAVLIAGGLFMLWHLTAATIVSAIFFAAAALTIGAFQIAQALTTRGWGGFLLSLVLGLFYAVLGVLLLINPLAAAVALTLLFAAVLIASGLVRLVLAYRWHRLNSLLGISGAIAILAGLVIFLGWPATGLWVLGLCLAIDILFHGIAWLAFGWALRPAN